MDLLKALQKERRTLWDRDYIIKLYLQRSKASQSTDAISITTYSDDDLKANRQRIDECEVAINAIKEFRKK